MRRLTTSSRSSRVWFAALALALILPVNAYGQGATNPTFTRIQQGASGDGAVIDCLTTSTNLLNCPTTSTASGDWRQVTCLNDGSQKVFICPGNCDCSTPSSRWVSLAAGSSFVFGASAKSLKLSCLSSSGTNTVRCYAER
jgi:hypothetical protein